MTKKSVIASGFCIKSAWASFFCELLRLCLNMTNVAKNVKFTSDSFCVRFGFEILEVYLCEILR